MQLFKTIAAFNEYACLEKPLNDAIDVGYYGENSLLISKPIQIDFYRISIKSNLINELAPDFDPKNSQPIKGVFFMNPEHPLDWKTREGFSGMYIHISKKIIEKNRHLFYNYLGYGEHEALFITDEEEQEIKTIFNLLYKTYLKKENNQNILLSYIHLLITHIETFYHRQFNTEVVKYNYIVTEFQQLIHEYYKNEVTQLPTVRYFADKMNLSPNYLGDIIKHFTQKSALDTIHDVVIEKAKNLLEEGQLTNSEIAYKLGFEYPNYFAKFFKKKTTISPKEYKTIHK